MPPTGSPTSRGIDRSRNVTLGGRSRPRPSSSASRRWCPLRCRRSPRGCRERLEGLDRLPSVIEHRDFAPWNLLVDEDGVLRAVDWESSVRCGLPLLDLWYFLTYLALAVERVPERRLADAYPQLVDRSSDGAGYRLGRRPLCPAGRPRSCGGPCPAGAHLDGPHALGARTPAPRCGPRQRDVRPTVGPRDDDLMHILVITDGFPYPLTSGRLRQFHFLKQLGRSHRITLVSAVPPDHPARTRRRPRRMTSSGSRPSTRAGCDAASGRRHGAASDRGNRRDRKRGSPLSTPGTDSMWSSMPGCRCRFVSSSGCADRHRHLRCGLRLPLRPDAVRAGVAGPATAGQAP